MHDSKLTVNDPNPEASHRPILYDSGRPSSVIWFRTLHATMGLGHSPASGPGAKPIPDNRFVPKERMLHPRLELVAGLLLPAAPAERPHVRDRAISRARPRPTPRHPRGLGRWNHDSRVTHLRRCVERDRIVGRVSGHPCDLIVDRLNEVDANGRVIHRRLGQRVSDDHAHSINSKMQRLPASVAASTVVHRSPFAFAHNRQSRAVDDAMDGSSRWDAAEFNRERLTSSGERGVVGGAARSTPINDKTDRQKPSAWRKGTRKTRRSVNAVSIAQSENVFGAPGRPDGAGRHASVASAESPFEDWSRAEVEATVADYFDMLDHEVRGRDYNKSAHRRRLAALLNHRTDGAIERKHQNISAILIELGFVYVVGYKPLRNYQQLLFETVKNRLAQSQPLADVVRQQVSEPAPVPTVDDILASLVDPPVPDADRAKSRPSVARERLRLQQGVDYLAIEAANSSLGAAGEEFVLRFEIARLV